MRGPGSRRFPSGRTRSLPPLAAVAFQLLGYYLGAERGFNPDTLRTDDIDHARAWLTAFPFGSH